MTEVQAHGKLWETEIAMNVYGATDAELKRVNYTATHDIPASINHLNPDTNISVKVSCSDNTVGMGDPLRVFDTVSSGHKLHAVVLTFEQDCEANTKTMKRIVELDLSNSVNELFGTITRKDLEDLNHLIHAVPKDLRARVVINGKKVSPPSPQRTAYLEKQVELLGKSGAIFLNPKLDETNCRLQCSFNKFQKFLIDYPDRLIAESTTSEFRGGHITQSISSSPRTFTKKKSIEEGEWKTVAGEPGILEGMTISQLSRGATIAGVKKTGKKADLVSRIRSYYTCKPCEDTLQGGSRKTRKNRN